MRWPKVQVLLLAILAMQAFILLRSTPAPPQCPSPPPAPRLFKQVSHVGVLVVATGRYVQFIAQLLSDLSQHFLSGYNVTAVIFTDDPNPPGCTPQRCRIIPHVRFGWPYDTLLRWEAYANASRALMDFDFLFAVDADMRIESTVGTEIFGPLVGVLHPAYYSAAVKDFTYEQSNKDSTAYIAPGEGHHYFAGGVSGGQRKEFLDMARSISTGARRDLAADGFIARWHDESHLNRYFLSHPPSVILSPAYCYPESWRLPFPRKILALDKNHAAMRASAKEERPN